MRDKSFKVRTTSTRRPGRSAVSTVSFDRELPIALMATLVLTLLGGRAPSGLASTSKDPKLADAPSKYCLDSGWYAIMLLMTAMRMFSICSDLTTFSEVAASVT